MPWARPVQKAGPFFRRNAGPLTLAAAAQKTYSIGMTKKIMQFAIRMRRAWVQKVTEEIHREEMRHVSVREQIISLSEEEAAFVALESRRLLRAQRQEAKRKRRLGIPPPPTPGKISYAVYM